jgi:hypothetical protein
MLLSALRRASLLFYNNRPIHKWPKWLGLLHGINLPSNLPRKEITSAWGGANINIILELLERVIGLPGDLAECGVFQGATLLTIAVWCRQQNYRKRIFGLDSFEGFDNSIGYDLLLGGHDIMQKRVGGFGNTSQAMVEMKIGLLGLGQTTSLVRGYFVETLPSLEHQKFCFVHLDCDIYTSYRLCLYHFYPRMTTGGIILFDEYNDPPWPGCNKAVDEFLANKPEPLEMIERDRYQKYYLVKR